jgi:hypothetical protein
MKNLLDIDVKYADQDELYKYFTYKLPQIIIGRCQLPVEGVEFREGKLYVSGTRIDLLSDTRQRIIAIQLGIKLAEMKGHKVICLDGIDGMDDEHRKEFMDIVNKANIAVVYTRWGKPEGDFEIEVR